MYWQWRCFIIVDTGKQCQKNKSGFTSKTDIFYNQMWDQRRPCRDLLFRFFGKSLAMLPDKIKQLAKKSVRVGVNHVLSRHRTRSQHVSSPQISFKNNIKKNTISLSFGDFKKNSRRFRFWFDSKFFSGSCFNFFLAGLKNINYISEVSFTVLLF